MLEKLFEALTLGIIGGAVPGPILTAVFTEVLNGGFKRSFKVITRALFVEACIAVLIMLVIFALQIPSTYFYVISLLGAAYLIYLSGRVWQINKIDGENKEIFTLSKIFLLTILNGGFWIFWLTICVPRAFVLKEQVDSGHFLFILVFELGWLLMTGFLAYIFSRFRPLLLKKNLVAGVFKFFAVLLAFFALKSVYVSILFLIK